MLTSEFNQEMGSLLRSLEQRVRTEPELTVSSDPQQDALDHIERAIIALVQLHIQVRRG